MSTGWDTLLDNAWTLASNSEQVTGLAGEALKTLVAPIGLVVAGAAGGYLAHRRIRTGQYETVTVGETYFIPSGVINPATGEEFVNMHRNTLDADFSFTKAFHGKLGGAISGVMARAVKKLSADEPVAFSHVENVVDKKHAEKYKAIIESHWKGYFGSFLNDEIGLQSPRLKGREKPEQNLVLVLPVWEAGTQGSNYKVLCIPPAFMRPGGLPKRENVRVQVGVDDDGKRIFEYCPGHEAYQRLETLREIRNKIGQELPVWLMKYGVSVFTGRMEMVPLPLPNP